MNYSGYVTAIGDLLQYTVADSASATPFADTDINNILPDMINYAELRMYREFDFLSTIMSPTAFCFVGNRYITVPSSLIVVESVNVITPVTKNPDDTGSKRNTVQRSSLEYINTTWPSVSVQGIPAYYAFNQTAMTNNPNPTTIVFGPAPDAAYTVELNGTGRPAALSSTNTNTFITANMPDLFIAASMVFGAGFQSNYGAESDDPKMAMSWESIYQNLKASAMIEELRKKAQSEQWQPFLPSPVAPRA